MPEGPVRRVLMTADTVGGVWTFALTLAGAWSDCGIEVLLATMGQWPSAAQSAEAAAIENLRLAPSPYKLEWMDDPWDDVEASRRWLLDLEKQFSPDVIHLNSFGQGPASFEAPALLTVHSCVTSWWAAVKGEPLPATWSRYRSLVNEALRHASLVTAPSRAMLAAVEEHYGPSLPRREVVVNGLPAGCFAAAAKEPFVLAAGRLWDEGKNISALAGVAPRLPWPVYLAGEEMSGLPGCRMLGRLDRDSLAGWYGRASIYAHPARYEPFGLSILEAALSGCALVLGDIASLREIWGDAALYVHPDDTAGLEAALQLLIERPELREDKARRSGTRARSLSAARMARNYAGLYESLAGERRMACSL